MIIPCTPAVLTEVKTPQLGAEVFVAPDAWVIGDVELADQTTVLFGAVLRGDILPIKVGKRSNIQDGTVIHTSHGRTPTIIGEEVTVGHRAVLHGCRICDRVLIGMGVIVLDETVIEEECVIAAGSVVTEHKRIPARSMVMGVPGKVVRTLTDDEIKFFKVSAERYVKVGANYRSILK